ncbi:MAG TPA: DinB family protein [Candidatus Limnocylindrales bacterium]|nr:DinB family protein [Candidatus Limnocylindrales bacterium]
MTPSERSELIERYRAGFAAVDDALAGITDAELDRRPPGEGEWTAREIVHHLADSESMAYIRLRRVLAEDDPLIQGYDEPEWARRLDYDRPIEPSIAVARAVRASSAQLLASLDDAEWSRTGTHSESGSYGVERWLQIYAGHPADHAAQIRRARSA